MKLNKQEVTALNSVLDYMRPELVHMDEAGKPENHIGHDIETLLRSVERNKSAHCRRRTK